MNNVFKTKLDTASLVLIPACIGINYLGKLFASVLKLPLWLDAIGTCIGGAGRTDNRCDLRCGQQPDLRIYYR